MAYEALKEKNKKSFITQIQEGEESQEKLLKNTYIENEYENSPQEAVDIAKPILNGEGASRVMGGGFKGCTLNFVSDKRLKTFIDKMKEKYGPDSIYLVKTVEGSHRL